MPISIPAGSDFTLANLPFGIFSTPGTAPRAGVAVGDHVLDLAALATTGCFDFDTSTLSEPTLNRFIALGKSVTDLARTQVKSWLVETASDDYLYPRDRITMHLPVAVGDYTDFYSSIEHATNVGRLFRDPENALLPNWRHLPVGYHGRASSIVVSGTPVRRPLGQTLPPGSDQPIFGPSQRLDYELEMAFVIGKDSELGRPIPVEEAEEYIFGLVLFNDWSARDIQQWEYVPLGPFLGKSFASSMSPWIVPLAALEPFFTRGPAQHPEPLPYLRTSGEHNLDIDLEIRVNDAVTGRSNAKHLYWRMAQQLAHHTSNGCNVRVGDVMASGTISGPGEDAYGSLLEATQGGKTGEFLQDGDVVTMTAHAGEGENRVGFGEVGGTILPAFTPQMSTD